MRTDYFTTDEVIDIIINRRKNNIEVWRIISNLNEEDRQKAINIKENEELLQKIVEALNINITKELLTNYFSNISEFRYINQYVDLQNELKKIKQRHRQALALYYCLGYNQQEISEKLSRIKPISQQGVGKIINTTLIKLTRNLI